MRIDRFLWLARLAKTRSAAQTVAESGRIRLDGRVIDRAHVLIRVGQILTLIRGGKARVLRIEALPVRRGPALEARSCYADIAPAIDAPRGET
ncbi:MAG: RNA-binding S4 domain-containing protein [Sphingomonadaceae bacterium]|nr:RNA-binding S4 domain-containing protein [Sphingomonadaceae bacterium]